MKRKQEQMSPTLMSPISTHTITTLHQTTGSPRHLPPVTTPQPTIYPMSSKGTRGVIVYPEFVNFLIHPNVDLFRDIPRLPGQRDDGPLPDQPQEGWRESDNMDTSQQGTYCNVLISINLILQYLNT